MKTALIIAITLLFIGCKENSVNTVPPPDLEPPAWLLGSFDGVYYYGYGDMEKVYDPTIITFSNGKFKIDLNEKYYNSFQDTYTFCNNNGNMYLIHDNPPQYAPPRNTDTVFIRKKDIYIRFYINYANNCLEVH